MAAAIKFSRLDVACEFCNGAGETDRDNDEGFAVLSYCDFCERSGKHDGGVSCHDCGADLGTDRSPGDDMLLHANEACLLTNTRADGTSDSYDLCGRAECRTNTLRQVLEANNALVVLELDAGIAQPGTMFADVVDIYRAAFRDDRLRKLNVVSGEILLRMRERAREAKAS